MDFRILGPVEVADGKPLPLGGAQQRALLALLVGHAGKTLATDRLVDELWGERPPPTAVKTVQVYVSQLRKLLGPERVIRDGRGYRLVADASEVDAQRFERRTAEARAALDEGRTEEALAAFGAADALWRGPALAGVELTWAVTEAARLEDERAAAREDRIDAELALGRHAALIAELDALCRERPLHERPAGQRMLALYRAGRQAEALAAYRETRERFVEELGIEPGPELRELEHAILVQDPALAAPPRVLTPAARRRRRAFAFGLAAVIVGAVAALAMARGDGPLVPPGPNTAVAIDPESLRVVHRVKVGDAPSAVAVTAGGAWVVNGNDETMSFVDTGRGEVARTFSTRGTPLDVAAGAGAVWVVDRPSTLVSIDPQAAQIVERRRLPRPPRLVAGAGHQAAGAWVAAVDDEVWVSDGTSLWRVRPGDRVRMRRGAAPLPGPIAAASSVWVGGLARVDRDTLRSRVLAGVGKGIQDIAVGAGAIWIADGGRSRVLRVDPRSGRITRIKDVGGFPTGIAVGEGAVWVSVRGGDVVRLDSRDGAVTGRVAVGGSPRAVAAGEGLVWVAVG